MKEGMRIEHTSKKRQPSQDPKRGGDLPRRFMRNRALHVVSAWHLMRVAVVIVIARVLILPILDDLPTAKLTKEDPDEETRHIEGRHDGRRQTQKIKRRAIPLGPLKAVESDAPPFRGDLSRPRDERGLGLEEDLILGKESTGEG